LYGRDQQVLDLLTTRMPVTVVSGDSGVGKTRVLEEVAVLFDGVTPAPVAVGHAPAALQASLLDALEATVALVAKDEGAARRVGRLLVEGGRRLAEAKASEVGLAIVRIVLGAVRDRVGKNVTDVIGEYFEQVRGAAADDVTARIRQAGDPDVIHAIAALTADVADAAGGKRILLTLDNVEHIQPDDRGRLKDLGPLLPDGISVLCTFTSVCAADESILNEYTQAGMTVYPLLGLEAWAVEQWLGAEGLPPDMAKQVLVTTNGYGFTVANAVQLLRTGQPLTDAVGRDGREEILRAATSQALRELDTGSHIAALKLSVLSTPLPSQNAAAYLGMEPAAWAATQARLLDSRIFVAGRPPWFHDQRRRLLREQVQDSDLSGYLRAASTQLRAIAEAGPGMPADALMQYAEISDALVDLGAADPSVAAVAHLSHNALAVLGAIIELADGDGLGPSSEQVLLYARGVFRCGGDPAAALAELQGSELAVTPSDEYQTSVVLRPGSPEAVIYAYGKIGLRLGRIPFPRMASVVFNGRMRAALGPFAHAIYGVGEPSLRELSRQSLPPRARLPHVPPSLDSRRQPRLLVRGLFGDIPIYAAVAYRDQPDRDSALVGLGSMPSGPLLGRRVVLTSVTAKPDASLPSRRLACAFERALGFRIGNITNSHDSVIRGKRIPWQDAVEQQLTALNLLAELSNERERQVTGFSALHYGLLRWVSPDGQAELTGVVANASGIIEVKDVPTDAVRTFDRVALGQLAGLLPGQRIGYMQSRYGQQTEVTDLQLAVNEVTRHARMIDGYNDPLVARRQLPADVSYLQSLIQEQLDERELMARHIADRLGRALPPGRDIYLLIDPHVRDRDMIPWAGQDATIVTAQMRDASPRVRIAMEPHGEFAADRDWTDSLTAQVESVFGIADIRFAGSGLSSALDAVSRLLGHMFNDILLT
jgi:hypothetical protein